MWNDSPAMRTIRIVPVDKTPAPAVAMVPRLGVVLLLLITATACRQDMHDQPKYKPLSASGIFEDGRSARPLVPGTVAQGFEREDEQFYTGKVNGNDAVTFPFAVTAEVLDRGQERFNIYCSVCHGYTGAGDGMVVQRGFRRPPSYHIDRLRQAPAGHFFDVITNGFGAMPDYASQIGPRDRWAIIAYIRALQLSQDATVGDVTPEGREKLGIGGDKR